ncbi:MAG: DUF6452 family protein [Lachnoclostridium sp.]|nr:DUF6452 family protein [Lachnoclostridium sp.]
MYKILPLLAASAVLMLGVTSCNTAGCTDNQNSLPLAGYYSMSTKKAISLSQVGVMGVGAPGDSLLYLPSQTLSQIYLPFRSTAHTTSYRLIYNFTVTEENPVAAYDEITFNYDSEPWFASEECGAMYRYRIKSYTYTRVLIDSLAVTDSLITNLDREQIRIYLRDNSEEEEGGEE